MTFRHDRPLAWPTLVRCTQRWRSHQWLVQPICLAQDIYCLDRMVCPTI